MNWIATHPYLTALIVLIALALIYWASKKPAVAVVAPIVPNPPQPIPSGTVTRTTTTMNFGPANSFSQSVAPTGMSGARQAGFKNG